MRGISGKGILNVILNTGLLGQSVYLYRSFPSLEKVECGVGAEQY
jgi:hypothetical protein